jgi:hypothetical protein
VPQHVAEGVVMNFQDESGLDTGIQEHAPRAGRGGFGIAQWTGPRRVALEDFARAQAKPVDDLDLQLDNFMRENVGEEAAAWQAVMNSPDRNTAAVNFVNKWERPASEHAAARTAKYSGAGDSPSEGGSRFGGTGLAPTGQPAPVPDSMFGGGTEAAEKTPESWQKRFAKGLGKGLEGMGGSGVSAPASTITETPKAALAQNTPTLVGGEQGELQRQKLAMMMAKLNSGKLWV